MNIDTYNTEKAKEYRSKLEKISDEVAELQYRLFCLQKKGKEIGEEYAIYLGIKEPDKKEEKEDVKES